ncbi:glycosyltransferase family 39 protein [Actinoplanes sp. NPDC026670]|uniref:glycosyltransferase family 39 protein n=1 Tax=Actinoplanes sp. NPDC026670 TaxID=3154700 RepID=UPI0033C42854
MAVQTVSDDSPSRTLAGPAPRRVPTTATLWTLAPSLIPALLMLVVGRFRLGNPSLGWDENASWLVSQRTPAQIIDQAGHFDGVIAPYYMFLHYWTALFGDSEVSMRMPSLIAVAVGVGVAGELGRRLFNPGVGLFSALLLVAVPQLSRYAQEARAYGLAFLFATTATLLLYLAVDRPRRKLLWFFYGLTVALTGLAHIFALLMLAGHFYIVVSRWWLSREKALFAWFPAAIVALLPVLPFVYLGATQRGGQLAWIAEMNLDTVLDAPGAMFGVTVGGLVIIGLALAARWPDRALIRELGVLAVIPPVALIGVSFVTDSVWVPRYVLFVLPAITLCAAAALHGLRFRSLLVFVLVAATAAPGQLELRGPATHMGADFRALSKVILKHQQPGDVIVYAALGNWSLRAGMDYQLRGKTRPADVLLQTPSAEIGQLAAVECADPAACLGQAKRVWYFRQWKTGEPLDDVGPIGLTLEKDYRQIDIFKKTKGTLVLLERRPG